MWTAERTRREDAKVRKRRKLRRRRQRKQHRSPLSQQLFIIITVALKTKLTCSTQLEGEDCRHDSALSLATLHIVSPPHHVLRIPHLLFLLLPSSLRSFLRLSRRSGRFVGRTRYWPQRRSILFTLKTSSIPTCELPRVQESENLGRTLLEAEPLLFYPSDSAFPCRICHVHSCMRD